MKKKFTVIYSIISIAIMFSALLFLGINLRKEYKQGASRSASVFASTVYDLYQELEVTNETKRNFEKKITSLLDDFQDYSFFELRKEDTAVFSYPADSTQTETESSLTKPFSTMLTLPDESEYLLTCNIYLLRPSSIAKYTRIAFFIILAITLITFILIFATKKKPTEKDENTDENLNFDEEDFKQSDDTVIDENKTLTDEEMDAELEMDIKENITAANIEDEVIENYDQKQKENEADESEETNDIVDDDNFSDIQLEDFDDNLEDIPAEEEKTEVEIESETEDETIVDETPFDSNDNIDDELNISLDLDAIPSEKDVIMDRKNAEKEIVPEETVVAASPVTEEQKETTEPSTVGPEGLFSPVTGLGWESYLITRLDNEIERSVASEMDISLFVIQITDLDRNTETMKEICNYIVDQFQFRDLIFEYKEDCIVAIKNGTTLEDALNFADKIHLDILKLLTKTLSECYIGISTRSVRIISGERFLKEADEALMHAKEDLDCPIIAFRADVEKYRKYLEKQSEE